jgi:gliding motility-associated-like protein
MRHTYYITCKKISLVLFSLAGFILCNPALSFGQLCTGSLGDPVVDITFGLGTATHSGALASGTTSYTYSSADFPTDGSYTVENTTAGSGNVWWSTTDHTGNTGGYMMVVNASVSKTDYFYKSTVTGLCPGTTYEFAAWVVNLLRSRDISPPNITFTISTTTGTVLGTYTTGAIPLTTSGPTWKQYGLYFTTPTGVSDVVIQMTNNSAGGAPANDLALDDITFRPCGPIMVSSFSSTSAVTTQSSCAGTNQSYTLSSAVSTGYQNPVYQWQINSGSGWVNIAGATTTTYTVNYKPAVAGTYQYRLISSEAANAGSEACEVASNILTLTVIAAPMAAFTSSGTNCLGDAVAFADKSTSPSLVITQWSWNFGDGQTSTLQNPSHTFAASGNYNVTLTVTNSGGCSSTSAAQTVHVNAKPVAAFTYSSPNCAGQAVTFTDQSTSADGSIAQWIWNYGDGSSAETVLSNTLRTHIYTTAASYTVTLQVVTSGGCLSLVSSQTVVIHPLPVADFSLPDVCLSDAYAQFNNLSTIADGTTSGFTYLWNFGDPNATTANPNTSTEQNPKHKYSKADNYTVTLTVTSANDCVSSIASKAFMVNGAVPQAGFTVPNSALCSSDPVEFDNTSTVDFGNITKIVFYFDYNNSPSESSVYYKDLGQIPADNKFYHSYGLFNDPSTKNYLVRMVVYSGEACSSTFQKTITVIANPVVTLSTVGALCQQASPVQITENKNGFTGTDVFSGTGVSSTGLFDPTKSGAGTFTISYLFTAQNGCTYSTSQTITVNPQPTITLPETVTLLEGGQVTLPAKASGDGLSYLWTPSTGLNNPTLLNPVATPSENIQYQLTVTSSAGCTAAASVYVSVLKEPVVPNTFTPNGDGINDTWVIQYLDSYPNCTVEIFNRYGQKLYYSIGYPSPWDGIYNGSSLPVGVYYYIINPKNGRKVMAGSLTILR